MFPLCLFTLTFHSFYLKFAVTQSIYAKINMGKVDTMLFLLYLYILFVLIRSTTHLQNLVFIIHYATSAVTVRVSKDQCHCYAQLSYCVEFIS